MIFDTLTWTILISGVLWAYVFYRIRRADNEHKGGH